MADSRTFDREFKVEIAKQVASGKRGAHSMARLTKREKETLNNKKN